MRCGFIGYGNMGSAVVRALLGSGSLCEHEVIVYNRTLGRLDDLRRQHPGAVIASSMSSGRHGQRRPVHLRSYAGGP